MSDWTFRVDAFDMTYERAEELFEAIADLAHDRDEEVMCTMGPYKDADDE